LRSDLSTPSPATARGFVLNCGDDDVARGQVTHLLQQAGYDVREATSGQEALEIASTGPALVVIDDNLPGLSGLEVCRRLKTNPATASIPVLQTSATFISPERRVQGLECGADGYLTQPIEPPVLIATVRALLRAREAEDNLRHASMIWQATFDAIGEGVAVIDAGGRVLQANIEMTKVARRDRRHVIGASFEELLRSALHLERLSLVSAVLRKKTRESLELPGSGRWYRVAGDPVIDPDGEVRRVVMTVSDITELKELEETQRRRADELMGADRRKDEFLAMLAHELRNPLNAIATANSLQERVGAQDPQNMRLRAMIARQTRHLARLVDDLLEVSRITRGQIQLQTETGDLRNVVRQAIQSTLPQVEAKHQQLTMQLPADAVYVSGDMVRLEQVLVNIIGNASKYSGTDGHISVRCEVDSDGVEVRVKDDGVGIPSDQLASIFDLFVQVDQSLARSVGGLGIGLTIARRLVELHGGTIEACSEGVGRGAEFVIRLPVVEAGSQPIVRLPSADALSFDGNRREVIVIEDNADTRELMRTLLESWGHHVTVAADGTTGLALALERRPAVALIDVGLPGIDGYQVAQNLRASSLGSNMLLIALTGYGRPEDRARALESGFDLHLVKPVQPEKLFSVLAHPHVSARGSSVDS
jgi:PAS domain S-box-containing protein